MTRPRLLDLFCGAGGASMGYYRAGFDVFGVDIVAQPNYPFPFIRADALHPETFAGPEWRQRWGIRFSMIHASPPCQAYMRSGLTSRDGRHPDLLSRTRELLQETELPYVIENVPGAPMRPDVILCGSMFGLQVRRHRWFELSTSQPMLTLACNHSGRITGVYGNPHGKGGASRGMLPSDIATWSRAMGIDWMLAHEISAAIPPAYTEFIGGELLAQISSGVVSESA